MEHDSARRPTAAALFRSAWDTLIGVLGTQATAVLMRRAALARAHERGAEPDRGLVVVREDLVYTYLVPRSWESACPKALEEVRELLAGDLIPLLEELTGPVAVNLLLSGLPPDERRRISLRRGGRSPRWAGDSADSEEEP